MKKSKALLLVCVLFVTFSAWSQLSDKGPVLGAEFKKVQLSYLKTTSIVFEYPIKSIDKGSQEVLVQKAKAVENILLVKAGRENFAETNLTVVTADGKLFGFILTYDALCPDLNLIMDSGGSLNQDILFSQENENQKQIQQYALLALSKKAKIKGLKTQKFDIKLQLNGLFIYQDVLYYRIVLGNASPINYDVEQLGFFICDQKKSKRTASQEIEILPIFSSTKVATIPAESEVMVVFAIPKFTIPEQKNLTITLLEQNGERQIELSIKNSDLSKLQVLNSL